MSNDYRILITRDQNNGKSDEFIANFLAEEDAIAQGYDFGPGYDLLFSAVVYWQKMCFELDGISTTKSTQFSVKKRQFALQEKFQPTESFYANFSIKPTAIFLD